MATGPGQKIHRAGMKRARGRRAQKFARRDLERFQRDIHRLELGVAAADERAERHKTEVLVQPLNCRVVPEMMARS